MRAVVTGNHPPTVAAWSSAAQRATRRRSTRRRRLLHLAAISRGMDVAPLPAIRTAFARPRTSINKGDTTMQLKPLAALMSLALGLLATGSATVSRAIMWAANPSPAAKTRPSSATTTILMEKRLDAAG